MEAALVMSHAVRLYRLDYTMRGGHSLAIIEATGIILMQVSWSVVHGNIR